MSSHSSTARAGTKRDRSFSSERHRKSLSQHKDRAPKVDLSRERWKHDRYMDLELQRSPRPSSNRESMTHGSNPHQYKHESKKMASSYRESSSSEDERTSRSLKQLRKNYPRELQCNVSSDIVDDFPESNRRSRKGSSSRSIHRHERDNSTKYRRLMDDNEEQTRQSRRTLSERHKEEDPTYRRPGDKRRRAAEAQEDDSDAEIDSNQVEAMYLPPTEGLDQRKLRKRLLEAMDTISSPINPRPALQMDEDNKLYFLVKSGCPRNFKTAKELVIRVVQEVLKKMRQEAKHSLGSGSVNSSRATKKSSRRLSSDRTCSDISLSSDDDQPRRPHENRTQDRNRRYRGRSRGSSEHSPIRDLRESRRSRDRNSRDRDSYYREDEGRYRGHSNNRSGRGRRFMGEHDDRFYREEHYNDHRRKYNEDETYDDDRNFMSRSHGPEDRDPHNRDDRYHRDSNYPRRDDRPSGRGRYFRRNAPYDGPQRSGGPAEFGYKDEHGHPRSAVERDWHPSESDKDLPATTGVALIDAASAGMLVFLFNMDADVKERNIRSSFASRFGYMQTRTMEIIGFEPYQSDTVMGLAIVQFRTKSRSLVYALMKSPTLQVDQTAVPVVDLQGLIDSSDVVLKNRFASILRNKSQVQRLPGVFPQGVQPEHIVLVVDTMAPHIDLDGLTSRVISKIIRGVNLDAIGLYDLIREDDSFDSDNVLYVVIPWMSFFFQRLCVLPNESTCSNDSAKAKMNNSLEALVSSLNIVKDFCYNPILQSNLDGSTDFFSCLETPHISNTGVEKSAEALSRRLVYTAHNLRCSVLSRTQNSEMVFCGFPVTSLTTSEARTHSIAAIGEDQAEEVCAAVLTSMRVFNKFAASTWKLGGSQFSDLERLEEVFENTKDSLKNGSSTLKSNESKSAKSDNGSDKKSPKKTSEPSIVLPANVVCKSGETDSELNKCGHLSLEQWPRLTWVQSSSPQQTETTSDHSNHLEKTSAPCDIKGSSPQLKEEQHVGAADDNTEHLVKKTDEPVGPDSELEKTVIGNKDNSDRTNTDNSLKEEDSIKQETDSTKTAEDNNVMSDQEHVKSEKDFTTEKLKSASKDRSPKEARYIKKEIPGKDSKPATQSLLSLEKLKEAYTQEILRASKDIIKSWKKKGSFLPWTPLENEKFDSGTLPDIVAVSTEHHIFKEHWNGQVRQTEYTCLKCEGCTGDLVWAERHCYDRKHISQLLTNSPELTPEIGQLLVTGGGAKFDNTYGLTKEFLQKMVRARLLSIDDSKKKDVSYECLVCKQTFNKTSLRVHLSSFEHKSSFNRHLGLSNPDNAVTLTENWPIVKRLFRHSSFDAVVLVADTSLRSTLQPLVCSNVHLYTVPDLVMSEDARTEALRLWNLDCNQLLNDLDDPRVLWIVVAGLDLLLQPQQTSFFDSTFTHTAGAEEAKTTAASPKHRTTVAPTAQEGAAQGVDEKTASRMELEQTIQQVLDFIEHDPEVDDVESGVVTSELQDERPPAASDTKSEQESVQNELLAEGYQLEHETTAVGEKADTINIEKIDSATDDKNKFIKKTFKGPANNCCDAFSWDISSNSNNRWSLDKALNSLNDLRSFLRSRLDIGHTVLLMPVAPLHIVLDTVPEQTRHALSCLHQTVVANVDQVLGLQRAYLALFKKTYSLYRSISEQENVVFVEESAMLDASISIVKSSCGDVHWLNTSSWHVPLETLIQGAFMGLPCLYPKPTSVSYSELSLWPRTSACAIIGQPMIMPANIYTQNKLFYIPRQLTFSEGDVKFIVNSLAARTNYDKSVTWTCYLSCPFPQVLFTSSVLSLCASEGCANPIIAWRARKGQSLHRVLDRITSFNSLLSYALGPGNFATVYPSVPTAVVSIDEVNPETHPILHTVAMKNVNQETHFCQESYRDVVAPTIKKFKRGLTDIFNKSKMRSPIDIDDGDCFSFIKPSPLMRHGESLIRASEKKEWLALVNSILQNNHSRMEVMSTKPMTETEQRPGIFNPFTWSDKSYPEHSMDPSSADHVHVLGSAVPNYSSVGFNYDGDASSASYGGRGGLSSRGARGGPARAGFHGGPRFTGDPGCMPPQFNGPPGYFGPPPHGSYGPPGFFGPPGNFGPSSFRGRGGMAQGMPGYAGNRGFPGTDRFPAPHPFPDPNTVQVAAPDVNKLDKRKKKKKDRPTPAGIFRMTDSISSTSSSESLNSSLDSDGSIEASREREHSSSKSRSRSEHRTFDHKRKKSVKSSSDEEYSKSSKRRRKSRHSRSKGKKSSSKKSNRSKHGHSTHGSSNESEDDSVARQRSKKSKKNRHSRNRSVSSHASSDEYDARNPKTMIPKKQKHDSKWLPVAANAPPCDNTLPPIAAPSTDPPPLNAGPPPAAPNSNYKEIMTRIEHAITMSEVDESRSQKVAKEVAGEPSDGRSRYSIKLSSGQNPLLQVWVRRLVSYFQLLPDTGQLEDGSWLLRSNNSGVVAFLVKRLASCRLLGARITGTLHSAHESDTSFFGADWQHVFTAGLSNSFLIAADAVRSLCHRLPRPGPPCPRILVVLPDSSTARCLSKILQPVLATAGTSMLFVKGDAMQNVSCEVVVGTLHHLSEAVSQLQLREVRALIVDDAGFMITSPLHSILLAQLVTHLRNAVTDFGAVNIVAVADRINVQELTKAETLLRCRFIRTDLKQHFDVPGPSQPSRRHAAQSSGHYPPQAPAYEEAAWPPPAATDSRRPSTSQPVGYADTSPAPGNTRGVPSGPPPPPGHNTPGQPPRNAPPGYSGNSTREQYAPAGYRSHDVTQQHSGPPAYYMNRPPPPVAAAAAPATSHGYPHSNPPQQFPAPPVYSGGPPPQQDKPQQYPPPGYYGNQAAQQNPPQTRYQTTQPYPQQQQKGLPSAAPIGQQQKSVGEGYYGRAGPSGDLQRQHQPQSYSHYYNH